MHILNKVNQWTQNGPYGDLKQIDPITMITIGTGIMKAIGSHQEKKNEEKARESFMEEVSAIGEGVLGQYEDMMQKAGSYMSGGEFWRRGEQRAVDTAFQAAIKGEETMQSKGIDLSSYGSNVMQESIRGSYLKGARENLAETSKIGVQYSQMAGDMLKDYSNRMTQLSQFDYMSEAQETSKWTDYANIAGDMIGMYTGMGGEFGGGGGGGGNLNPTTFMGGQGGNFIDSPLLNNPNQEEQFNSTDILGTSFG